MKEKIYKPAKYSLKLARQVFKGEIEGRVGARIVPIDGKGHERIEKYIELLVEE